MCGRVGEEERYSGAVGVEILRAYVYRFECACARVCLYKGGGGGVSDQSERE